MILINQALNYLYDVTGLKLNNVTIMTEYYKDSKYLGYYCPESNIIMLNLSKIYHNYKSLFIGAIRDVLIHEFFHCLIHNTKLKNIPSFLDENLACFYEVNYSLKELATSLYSPYEIECYSIENITYMHFISNQWIKENKFTKLQNKRIYNNYLKYGK